MADPVCDVGCSRCVEKRSKRERDPTRTLIVIVVVLYLTCQALLMVFTISRKSPVGYSDDEYFPRNSSSEMIDSDVRYMQKFCDRREMDRIKVSDRNKENSSVRSTSYNDDTDKAKDLLLVNSHVQIIADERLTQEEKRCGVVVTYYVCDTESKTHSFVHRQVPSSADDGVLLENGTADSERTDLSAGSQSYLHNRVPKSKTAVEIIDATPLEDRTTFVDESLGFEIVIAHGECHAKKEKTDVAMLFVEVMKIALPLPILSTLLVYLYLPQLRTLQGKIIVCKLSSDLVYSLWPWYENDDIQPGLVLLASCVAGITWTTILCYDLWSTVTDPLPSSRRRSGSGRRFVRYSLIGWGHTAVFALVAFLAQLNLHEWFDAFITCEIYLIYIFLNVINLLFFAFTVKEIRRHNAQSLYLVKKGRKGNTAADGLNLYLKISAHMGVLSFVFENVDVAMIIFVDFNDRLFKAVLLGFSFLDNTFYFIVLVCNNKVMRLLRNKRKSTAGFR